MKLNSKLSTLFTPTNLAQYSGQSPAYQNQYIKQVVELLQANPAQAAKIVLRCLTENNEKLQKIQEHSRIVALDRHNDRRKIRELTKQNSHLSFLRESQKRTWKVNQTLQETNIKLRQKQASLNNEIDSIKNELQSARVLQEKQATQHEKQQKQLVDLKAASSQH